MKDHTYVSRPVDKDGYVQWSDEENKTWSILVDRQSQLIKGKACEAFFDGLEKLDFPVDRIPQIPDINRILNAATGWGVEPVPAIIQPKAFFTLLANKRFPAATFIRRPEDIDYIEEPDIFHEIYGHTPLLTNQNYADFMEKFGKLALQADPKDRSRLFRLFWFTIEFGLLDTDAGLRAYGGGILSSIGETQFCLSGKPMIQPMDALTVLRTPYRIDIIQPLYFVISDFSDLFSILEQDILALLIRSKTLGDNPALYPQKIAPEKQAS
ncbi:phenylalanine 4-monooxygenase [Marinomonas algicola]|uniref:phenylalanine 4-monooxygenase n=1 Tax=Marinomonas algicola TaxID=2773454 RepID=UPI00174E7DB8|nr:phenylalanine 4-monooxygenase [Marinomonas algicola]